MEVLDETTPHATCSLFRTDNSHRRGVAHGPDCNDEGGARSVPATAGNLVTDCDESGRRSVSWV